MKPFVVIVYFLIGCGFSFGMDEREPAGKYDIAYGRVLFWPFGLGVVIARHNQFITDANSIAKAIADTQK